MNSIQPISFYFSSHFSFFLFTLIVFLAATFTSTSTSYLGNETDHLALLSFKSMITSDPFGALTSWNTSIHFCDWSGVTCGNRHRRVTVIKLKSQGLHGSLSPHVGNLSFLRNFSLFNNTFQGNIPNELGRLFRLQLIDLEVNHFSGVIPANLSRCNNLQGLGLSKNNLTGNIPNEVSLLTKLTFLSISDNNLTGGIPPSLGNLTSMETFYATQNPFGGNIPDTLGNWKSLRKLTLGGCDLHGTIPLSIYNLSLLTNFSLAENQLTGSLPPSLGTLLPHLEFIQLRNNHLSGLIPPSISNCSNLVRLEMSSNRFSGKVKIDFARLREITEIELYGNNFGSEEANDLEFIDSLKNCSKLEWLELADNKLRGMIPNSIGNISTQLQRLALESNRLYGNFPSSIGNLVSLTVLALYSNQFTGNIPSTIGQLHEMVEIDMGENQFSGAIPDSISNLSLLYYLYLSSNRLEGSIPSSLGNCHKLSQLYLNQNNLSGEIPKELLQLSSLTIALDLSQNNLFGSLPSEVENLKSLTKLDLSNNNLSGKIPSSLAGCTSLEWLMLKGNLFQGPIPPSLSSLRGVRIFDISHNNLSGHIPQFMGRFTLEYLDLSYNDFEGEVPMDGVFTNATAVSVLGNSKLCGGVHDLGLPKCKKTKKNKKWFPLVVIVILIPCILLASSISLLFVRSWHKKRSKDQQSGSSINGQFLKVTYNQLLKATNGFSEANLIGASGFSSVYKGILDHDSRFVAIKVLHLQNRRAYKSFVAECETWRSIRHRNLLKIITSCSSVDNEGIDFKALVYEFMPNGSLDGWLHSSANPSGLNILQRASILFDVACALDYLHNRSQTAIVHCDLKPSNILLDDDMVAHVGDFGLAKFLQTNVNYNSSSGIRGTIGYVAPEYGLGSEMTTSGDVYSFGILLLEVMTGRRPTDDIFSEGLNLHKFVYMALPDHVIDIIDGKLLTTLQNPLVNAKKIEDCLASILKIGVACSVESVADRMNIENVVHELQHIKNSLQNINVFEV